MFCFFWKEMIYPLPVGWMQLLFFWMGLVLLLQAALVLHYRTGPFSVFLLGDVQALLYGLGPLSAWRMASALAHLDGSAPPSASWVEVLQSLLDGSVFASGLELPRFLWIGLVLTPAGGLLSCIFWLGLVLPLPPGWMVSCIFWMYLFVSLPAGWMLLRLFRLPAGWELPWLHCFHQSWWARASCPIDLQDEKKTYQ